MATISRIGDFSPFSNKNSEKKTVKLPTTKEADTLLDSQGDLQKKKIQFKRVETNDYLSFGYLNYNANGNYSNLPSFEGFDEEDPAQAETIDDGIAAIEKL